MPSKQVQAMTKEQCSTLQCHVMFLVPRPSGNPGALPRDFGIIVIIVIIIGNAIITIITIIIINTIIDVILISVTDAIIFIRFWTESCKISLGIPSLTLFGVPNTVFGIFGRTWACNWARQIWSSGISLKISCKMQFRCIDLVSIGPPSQKVMIKSHFWQPSWTNTKLRHWKGTPKELLYFTDVTLVAVDIKSERFIKRTAAGLVWYDHGDNNVWYKILRKWKCQMLGSLWWVSIIWWCCPWNGKKFMMGVHHMMRVHYMYVGYSSLRVPKASRHLQHKHQERSLDIIMTD